MEEDEVKEQDWKEQLCKDTEKHIAKILTDGISSSNLMNLSQLVDLQKDVSNIKYWEVKEMMYREDYGRRYRGDYNSDYGRRGVPGTGRGRYRGEDMIEDMRESYDNYMDGANSRYSGEADKSFKYMVKAMKDFYMHIMEEAESPEQKDMLRRTVQANNITIEDINDCMKKYDSSGRIDELSKQIEDLKNALKIEKAKK